MSVQMENKDKIERIARISKALSHPTRVAIILFLARQETCFFGDISEIFHVSKPTISQHLKELKDAGLIHSTVEITKTKYCICPENWELARLLFGDFFSTQIKNKEKCCP